MIFKNYHFLNQILKKYLNFCNPRNYFKNKQFLILLMKIAYISVFEISIHLRLLASFILLDTTCTFVGYENGNETKYCDLNSLLFDMKNISNLMVLLNSDLNINERVYINDFDITFLYFLTIQII